MQLIKNLRPIGPLAFGLLIFTASCGDIIEEEPFSQVSDAQFWQTNGDAEAGVAAIYDAMQETYRLNHYLWGEFRSDNLIASDRVSVEYEELVPNELTQSNAITLSWTNLYRMIGRANLAIDKIPKIRGFTPGLLGQAHALRAYAYFDAVRVWGSVPLYTEAVTNLDQDLFRPVTDGTTIMNEVVIPEDMLRAEELITSSGNEFRFTKAANYALQADVYPFLKDYDKANEALDKIIALNDYELVTDRESWSKLFLNDLNLGTFQVGPELIFSIRYDILEDGNRASGNYELFFAGIPNFFISPTLERKWIERFPSDSVGWYAKYPDFAPQETDELGNTLFGDWRYFESREDDPIGEARAAKYTKTTFSPNDDQTNISVYRYAGVLLLKALAENRLGNPEAAIELINQVRTARQLPLVDGADYLDVESLENLILDERQLELFAEGDRWWDLVATDKVQQALDTIATIPDNQIVFPIWERHLIDNPNLEQNPGYVQ